MPSSGVRVSTGFCKHTFTVPSPPEDLILIQREKRACDTRKSIQNPRSPVTYPGHATSQVKFGPLLQNSEGEGTELAF